MKKKFLAMIIVIIAVVAVGSEYAINNTELGAGVLKATGATKQVTDIGDRTVTVPLGITKVSGLHPIATYMTWRLAPNKLNSIDMVFNQNINSTLFPDSAVQQFHSLNVTGVYFKGMSKEQMIVLDPDVVVSMTKDPNIEQEENDYGAPIVVISKNTLSDYALSFQFMGELLGNTKDGNDLASYWNATINNVSVQTSKIPEDQRLKVYYASHDGVLSTVGPDTIMASIIRTAGGLNMMDNSSFNSSLSPTDKVSEDLTVSMEQILEYNPDVIITKTSEEKNKILSDSQWQQVNAVKNKRVYAARQYASLDGIQSLMGLVWTAQTLYPDKVSFNFTEEVKTFYSKFYMYNNMTDQQVNEETTL